MDLDTVGAFALVISAVLGAAYSVWRWIVGPIVRTTYRIVAVLLGVPPKKGKPGVPGLLDRLERIEWHVGNGNPVPLRRVVEEHGVTIKVATADVAALRNTLTKGCSPNSRGRADDK